MVLMQSNQSLKDAKNNFEKAFIEQAIEANDCRLRKAAEALDIHYSALLTKMKRNGISLNAIWRPLMARKVDKLE